MLKDHNYNKELPMIHQISHQDLEHVYADAVNTIQCEMNFVEAVKALEDAAKAGHGKAAMFLAELYYQGFRVERDSLKAQYWQKTIVIPWVVANDSG
jgi:TPR repeat protein